MIEILKESKVFRDLSDDHLQMISGYGSLVAFQTNETIIKEGQTGHSLFIVVKGQVEVVLPRETGSPDHQRVTKIRLSHLSKGDCIGEFSLIVETDNFETAIEKFEDRIIELRKSSDFFQGECRIFFVQLLEFESFPKTRAMMLNYKSIVGDPYLPFIGCIVPTEASDSCRIFDWKNDQPEIDGEYERLFLQFKYD